MKRIISLALVLIVSASLFAGCSGSVGAGTIDLTKSNYTVRENAMVSPEGTVVSTESAVYLDKYLNAIISTVDSVQADVYVMNFSEIKYVTEDEARSYLLPALTDKYGADKIMEASALDSVGAWTLPSSNGFVRDIKEIWISAYENADQQLEFIVDISRGGQPLRSLRYIDIGNGNVSLKSNALTPNNDGSEPASLTPLTAEETSAAKTLYFGGRLMRNPIFEKPVLDSVDFSMKIVGTPVEGGSLLGGFAGGFQGVVTIDGQSFPLTLDGTGLAIPIGIVSDPSQYYIAFSNVGVSNPQDTTIYRNVYLIKKDLTSVVGLYSYRNSVQYSDWFETARITSSSFDKKVKDNNDKLTSLYAKVILQSYGNRKEYNNTLAVVYNMFIGVDVDYLKPNLKKGISSVSKDVRDYAQAIHDSSVSRKGDNGLYFFPYGRSMVVRIFSYDGTKAIAAIDFSSLSDKGYGGLYSAEYTADGWKLTTLQDTRIK